MLKTKTPNEVKARLVTSSREPKGNGKLNNREEVVPPRVLDLVFSVL